MVDVKVRCHLREIRGPRPLREIARDAGVNVGELSQIERGKMLPKDDDIPRLAQAYGRQFTDWYPPLVLAALEVEDGSLDALRLSMVEAWVDRSIEGGKG